MYKPESPNYRQMEDTEREVSLKLGLPHGQINPKGSTELSFLNATRVHSGASGATFNSYN